MTEKEKGKFNPFVGGLRHDEEILWFHAAPVTMAQHQRIKATEGEGAVLFFMMIHMGVVIFFMLKGQLDLGFILLALMCIVPSVLAGLLLAFLRRSLGAYAVTNKRLLHYDGRKTTVLELEELATAYEADGALQFDFLYPTWHDVPDAKAVLRLIKKAAANRASELQEGRLDDEKREEQVQSLRTGSVS